MSEIFVSPEDGRKFLFQVVLDYRLFGLNFNSSDKEIDLAFEDLANKVSSISKNSSIPFNAIKEEIMASERILIFRKMMKEESFSKLAKLDGEDFFEGYDMYMKEHPNDENLGFIPRLLNYDLEVTLQPLKYKKRTINFFNSQKQFEVEGLWGLGYLLIGIPVLIVMWGIHPVVGILAIAFYLWTARNRFVTGYYFG